MSAWYYLHCDDCNEDSEGINISSGDTILQNLWENREVLIAANQATFIGISLDRSCDMILGFIENHYKHRATITNSYGDNFSDINQKKFIVIEDRRKNNLTKIED